jgi:hypothetical protein
MSGTKGSVGPFLKRAKTEPVAVEDPYKSEGDAVDDAAAFGVQDVVAEPFEEGELSPEAAAAAEDDEELYVGDTGGVVEPPARVQGPGGVKVECSAATGGIYPKKRPPPPRPRPSRCVGTEAEPQVMLGATVNDIEMLTAWLQPHPQTCSMGFGRRRSCSWELMV